MFSAGGVNALTVYEIGDAPTTPGPTPELTAEPTSEPTPNPEPTPEPMEEGYFERGCAVDPRSDRVRDFDAIRGVTRPAEA